MPISRLTALLVAASVAAFAGCGGDEDEPGKAASTPDAPPATVTATTGAQGTTTTPKGGRADPAPGRAVQAYFNALSRRDMDAACALMNPAMQRAAVRSVKGSSVKTCVQALTAIVKPSSAADLRAIRNVKILSSTVSGNTATVKVQRAVRDAVLTKSGERWIISGGIFVE
jgi:hypothetical protein